MCDLLPCSQGPDSEKLIKEYAYNCGRKYVTQNTPAVNAENNYFLIERPSENKLFYGRYNHRIKVVKEPVKRVSVSILLASNNVLCSNNVKCFGSLFEINRNLSQYSIGLSFCCSCSVLCAFLSTLLLFLFF